MTKLTDEELCDLVGLYKGREDEAGPIETIILRMATELISARQLLSGYKTLLAIAHDMKSSAADLDKMMKKLGIK